MKETKQQERNETYPIAKRNCGVLPKTEAAQSGKKLKCAIFDQSSQGSLWSTLSPMSVVNAQNNQKTGASLRNTLVSSDCTHRATAFAAETTADLDISGSTATYSSNGLVICHSQHRARQHTCKSMQESHPCQTRFIVGPHVHQLEARRLARARVDGVVQPLICRHEPVPIRAGPVVRGGPRGHRDLDVGPGFVNKVT